MPTVHISVLGPLEVDVDGQPVVVPPGRRRVVLACLVAHRGRAVSAEALIEAAWGQALPHDPRAALHTVISRLRSVLGEAIVRTGPAGYLLDLPAECTDVGLFESHLAGADGDGPKGAADRLERALALWRGPAYADAGQAPFVMVEAMRLAGLRADATERLAALAVEAGDVSTAVALARGLLAVEPFRDRAVEVLVTALHRDGRQADALAECRRYRALLAEELGLDLPPSLARLQQRVLGHDLPVEQGDSRAPSWLDTSTAFIGREDELADLVSVVADNRLTVITGTGGVGKTRLAAEALPSLHARFGWPVSVIELAPVAPGGVALAVASGVGLRPESAAGAGDALVDRFEVGAALLVLDNCEHVLAEVTDLARRMTGRCREVRVLATSRHRLGIEGERVVPLAPLAVPEVGVTRGGEMAASVRLVADRVRRLAPTFAVTPGNVEQVARLCRRLDGLPLALELAASQVASRGLAAVLRPSAGDDPAVAELRDVVAWSYGLLTDRQRSLLMSLSVFTGDFTAEDVHGLVACLPDGGEGVDADLAELVDACLVTCHHHDAGMRHRLLAIVRGYAADRLRDSCRADVVHRAHADWVAGIVGRIAADWSHVDGAVIDARLRAAEPEVVAALSWALTAGCTALASQIATDVTSCLHWTPGVGLSSVIIEVAERGVEVPGAPVAGGVGAGAFFLAERGDLLRARGLAGAALGMAEEGRAPMTAVLAQAVVSMYSGDAAGSRQWFARLAQFPGVLADASSSLALTACYHEDLDLAGEHLEVALAAGACGADASLAFARFAAGEIALTGDRRHGAHLLRQAVADADRVGAEQVGRVARVALLGALTRGGEHDEAADLARWLLTDLAAKGVWPQLWTTLRIVAELLTARGRIAEAAFLLRASLRNASAPPLVGHDVERYQRLGEDLADRLGTRAVEGLYALAGATPRAHVVQRAEAALDRLFDMPTMEP